MHTLNKNHNLSQHFGKNRSTLKIIISRTKLTLIALLISTILVAQNGINYKALIKDSEGNNLTTSTISLQFIIYEGEALTNNTYQETHTTTTDANGFVIVNIGEGTTTDAFAEINWSADNHFLNVQIDSGNGLVDLGTTAFMQVPYAIQAESAANVTGLEAINQGFGQGWRLIGRNPEAYGNIGFSGVDLSYSNVMPSNLGATGSYSTALGINTEASGSTSTAIGSHTKAEAANTTALGLYSIASGNISTALGRSTNAEAYNSTAIGRFNVGGGNAEQWIATDPLFEIGNGDGSADGRRNALTVHKNGSMTLNSTTDGINLFSEGFAGIIVNSGNTYGISVLDAESSGVVVFSAENYGGFFNGNNAGVLATANNHLNPDIILGGTNSGNDFDDGIISSDPNYSGSDIYLRSNDAVIIQLDYDESGNGNFFIRDSDNDNVFSVSELGVIRQNGSTIHASDRRLKKDIADLPYGLKEILQLQPKAYHWKNHKQNKKSFGLIAQDVQPIINEVVNVQDNELKTLGISYTELIPVLIKAIQEQNKIIETQGEEIKASKTDYEALLSRIEIIESRSSN